MIEALFPTLLCRENLGALIDNNYLYQKSLEMKKDVKEKHLWDSVYNTLGTIDITLDLEVRRLVEVCKYIVMNFSREFGYKNPKVECIDCWFNVYEHGDYQEDHIHGKSHFSLVYYVKVPENSGSIVFTSCDGVNDTFSLALNIVDYTVVPCESEVILFRSNLHHRVHKNRSNEHRVSIAMNFKVE